MNVTINGVKYVPAEQQVVVESNENKAILDCLKILTSMRYFCQSSKMMPNTWDAINALSTEIANLDVDEAFQRLHPEFGEDE